MKKILFIALFIIGVVGYAQTKGTGINTINTNADADLELGSNNKGLLINRVALTNVTAAAPLSAHVAGMMVYNTATAGTAPNNVTPGYYYNNGTKWVKIAKDSNVSKDADIRKVGTDNHISSDAGVGSNGTSVGTGEGNIAIGKDALSLNTTGKLNTALGIGALSANTEGYGNITIGNYSGTKITTGYRNIIIGNSSGNYITGGTGRGFRNIIIGDAIQIPDPKGYNQLNIGNLIYGTDLGGTANNISHGGNIGIGTKNPSSRLHVIGEIAITQHPSNTTQYYVHNEGGQLKLGGNLLSSTGWFLDQFTDPQTYNSFSGFRIFSTDSTNRSNFCITDSNSRNAGTGYVGIGIHSPRERLHVNGKVRANSYIANVGPGTGYADYVFEKYLDGVSTINADYKFKSLAEVERFIKTNKHLPGVTGINELQKDKDGKLLLDIPALAKQSLEKIEELFLHTIEQQKTIEALNVENAALKARLEKIEQALGL